jgi:hypothetical protein
LQQRKKEIDVFSGRPQGFAFCPHALGGDYARKNSVALQKNDHFADKHVPSTNHVAFDFELENKFEINMICIFGLPFFSIM